MIELSTTRFYMKRGILFWIGLLFFIQIVVQGMLFSPSLHDEHQESIRYVTEMHLYMTELRLEHQMEGFVGSLIGCLGSWILLLYLKNREQERKIAVLLSKASLEKGNCLAV
jgi:Ni,Fe-hydrogenase I cytochrome b subunit